MAPDSAYRSGSTHHRDDRAATDVLELRFRMRDQRLQLGAAIANVERAIAGAQRARDSDDVGLLDYALQELAASAILALENLRAPHGAMGLIEP